MLEVRVSHKFVFEAIPDDTWPETVPWPCWKPNTDKAMRPVRIVFAIDVRENGAQSLIKVSVYGPRLIKNGEGANVDNDYYLGSMSCPEFVTDAVKAAQEIVSAKVKGYL